jgi:hypothetical protein
MGTALTGLEIKDTYEGLVKTTDNGPLSGTAKYLSDGLGNDSALALSTTAVGIGTSAPIGKLEVAETTGALEVVFSNTDATASTTIFEDNNLGKGIRIQSYGSTASGTLLDGTINRAGSVVIRTNDSSYPVVFGGFANSSEQYYFGRTGFTLALNTTTNNVTIGASSGTARLQVKGSGTTSATTALLVQNSAGTAVLTVKDGGADKVVVMPSAQIGSLEIAGTAIAAGGGASISFPINRVFLGSGSAETSARLQVDSTTQGFLPPRMTTDQKNAIATPAEGLVVYDTTLAKLCVYTTAWETITSL